MKLNLREKIQFLIIIINNSYLNYFYFIYLIKHFRLFKLNTIKILAIFYFLIHFVLNIFNAISYVEFKIIFAIFLLIYLSSIGKLRRSNEKGNILIILIALYSFFLIFDSYPNLIRASDISKYSNLISVYLGMICLFLSIMSVSFYYSFLAGFLCIITGSGTAIIGYLVYLISCVKFKKIKFLNLILIFLLIIFSVYVFYLSQKARGRITIEWYEIDRLIIFYKTIYYMKINMNFFEWFFGFGPGKILGYDYYFLFSDINFQIGNYLLSEGLGFGSGRNFHNDHLRVIFHYGTIGWLLLWTIFYEYTKETKLFLPIFISSFFGSIISITQILILLSIFNSQEINKNIKT